MSFMKSKSEKSDAELLRSVGAILQLKHFLCAMGFVGLISWLLTYQPGDIAWFYDLRWILGLLLLFVVDAFRSLEMLLKRWGRDEELQKAAPATQATRGQILSIGLALAFTIIGAVFRLLSAP